MLDPPTDIRKMANAFMTDAAPSDDMPSFALEATEKYKRKQGGLWVGGVVSISAGGVSFAPNGLNRALHKPLESINVPAGDIRAVRHEFGWVTGIVVVEHAGGEFRFRCFGAKRLAAAMTATFRVPE
jgi:hypothetical protein